jgi:hypothetical protein
LREAHHDSRKNASATAPPWQVSWGALLVPARAAR